MLYFRYKWIVYIWNIFFCLLFFSLTNCSMFEVDKHWLIKFRLPLPTTHTHTLPFRLTREAKLVEHSTSVDMVWGTNSHVVCCTILQADSSQPSFPPPSHYQQCEKTDYLLFGWASSDWRLVTGVLQEISWRDESICSPPPHHHPYTTTCLPKEITDLVNWSLYPGNQIQLILINRITKSN